MTWCIGARSSLQHEMEDIYVIKKGVGVGDRIVVEGILQVRDGEKVKYEFRSPEDVMGNLKNHADQIVVTSPKAMDVTITQPLCLPDPLAAAHRRLRLGQRVSRGDRRQGGPGGEEGRFDVQDPASALQHKADAEWPRPGSRSSSTTSPSSWRQTKSSLRSEVQLFEAKRDRAKAKAEMAKAELNFTNVIAPFDGIVDRQHEQLGSLINEGEILTTLSDNSVMWVYFNVPEKQYLEYMASSKQDKENQKIELELANDDKFPQPCINIDAIEGQFNNETGNIAFRADFPNPDGVLRHGQTGTILIHRTLKNALVIPQRATFELLDKRYVWVVGEDDVAHQSADHHQARTGRHSCHQVADLT